MVTTRALTDAGVAVVPIAAIDRLPSAFVMRYIAVIGSAVAATISFGAMKVAGDAQLEDGERAAMTLLGDRT